MSESESQLYLMFKPPVPQATAIDTVRQVDSIDQRYGRNRFHIRIMHFGSLSVLPPVAQIIATMSELIFDPFTLSLDRHDGRTMPVRAGARQIRQLRQHLISRFAAHGMLYTLESHPHLTLSYDKQSPKMPMRYITPITWTAEELLVIESGQGRHRCHAAVPLLRRQYLLFG